MVEYFDASKVKPPSPKMNMAEETFIAMRDLSVGRGTMFCWYQLRDCFAVINVPRGLYTSSVYTNYKTSWKMTLGNMLRGWLASGLVIKVEKGLYKFSHRGMNTNLVGCKLYASPNTQKPNFVRDAHLGWRMREELIQSRTY